MRGDLPRYEQLVLLPFNLETSKANLVVTTAKDLQDGFDDFTDMLESQGTTDMIRSVKRAHYTRDGDVVGEYETELLKGSQRVVPPFRSNIRIRNTGGVWAAVAISNNTTSQRWPVLIPRVAEDSLRE